MGLSERTLSFIHDQQRGQRELQASVAQVASCGGENNRGRARWVLANMREIVAVAACLAIVVLVSRPGVRHARQISQRYACTAQMQQAGVGVAEYAQDHQGFLPYVAHRPGAVWWNVGEQGQDNTSNTRNFFLLVKNGYLPARVFVCPGVASKSGRKVRIKIDPEQLKQLQDFASRTDVNYSFRLMFDRRNLQLEQSGQVPIMSDQNPLFLRPGGAQQGELNLADNIDLLRANSPNHGGQGQNILHPDGHVSFVPDRQMGLGDDDIFTIQSATRYQGNELPASEDDIFIAP